VLVQALMGTLSSFGDSEWARRIKEAVDELGHSPDAKQFSAVGRVLVSADYIQLGLIFSVVATALYVFGRPLAGGYRLSRLCLGRAGRLGPLRRRSELCLAAARLDTVPQEQAAVRNAGAEFRRDMPIDLLVKALPALPVVYVLTGTVRGGDLADVTDFQVAAWVIASLAIGVAGAWVMGRLRVRGRLWRWAAGGACVVTFVVASVAIAGVHALTHGDSAWFVLAAAILARLGWLALVARSRRCPVWWVVVPLALACALALATRWPAYF
jgi:hypothetical protein